MDYPKLRLDKYFKTEFTVEINPTSPTPIHNYADLSINNKLCEDSAMKKCRINAYVMGHVLYIKTTKSSERPEGGGQHSIIVVLLSRS